jgi:hypothetical protein
MVKCPEYAEIFYARVTAFRERHRVNAFEAMTLNSGLLDFRLLITFKGCFGLVPTDVEVGKVCVLYGGGNPFFEDS